MNGEFPEIFFRETAGQFNFAFATDIVEDNRIVLTDSSKGFIPAVDQNQREKGFVLLSISIGLKHGLGHGACRFRAHSDISLSVGDVYLSRLSNEIIPNCKEKNFPAVQKPF
jgi:hypothetical protein